MMDWENETKAQFDARYRLLRGDPRQYIELMSDIIRENSGDEHAFFARSQGHQRLGDDLSALDDLDSCIMLKPHYIHYLSRGRLLSRLGRHREALRDFNAAEDLARDEWVDCWGPLHQADCHSRLGNEQEALAACERLKEDHWTPGLDGAPAGSKQEVIEEVRRCIAALKG